MVFFARRQPAQSRSRVAQDLRSLRLILGIRYGAGVLRPLQVDELLTNRRLNGRVLGAAANFPGAAG